jgi:hypothetical protein
MVHVLMALIHSFAIALLDTQENIVKITLMTVYLSHVTMVSVLMESINTVAYATQDTLVNTVRQT